MSLPLACVGFFLADEEKEKKGVLATASTTTTTTTTTGTAIIHTRDARGTWTDSYGAKLASVRKYEKATGTYYCTSILVGSNAIDFYRLFYPFSPGRSGPDTQNVVLRG